MSSVAGVLGVRSSAGVTLGVTEYSASSCWEAVFPVCSATDFASSEARPILTTCLECVGGRG